MNETRPTFRELFTDVFETHFARIFRYLNRMTGDPDLAADLAQETFVRLYRRGSFPDSTEAWLISVATNLLRNARSTAARRRTLLAGAPPGIAHGAPPRSPETGPESECTRRQVRAALDRLPEREQSLLLLRAEGYSYAGLARALGLHEASVGTLLARARRTFEDRFREAVNEH